MLNIYAAPEFGDPGFRTVDRNNVRAVCFFFYWLTRIDEPLSTGRRAEGVEDALIHQIQLRLEGVKKLVQAARDDLTSVGVSQLGAQLTEALLGGIAVHSNGRTRNPMQGVIRGGQTIMDGARELVIEHEKFNN